MAGGALRLVRVPAAVQRRVTRAVQRHAALGWPDAFDRRDLSNRHRLANVHIGDAGSSLGDARRIALFNLHRHTRELGQGSGAIDLVVVNLYPFEMVISKDGVTVEDAIENIDIGGPSMLRSSAKKRGWSSR